MSGYLQTTGRYMKAYLALTIICYVLDIISFFVGCSHFGSSDDHQAYFATVLIAFAVFYCMTDIFYVIWAISIYLKLPKSLAKVVFKAAWGGVGLLTNFIET
jgi:hypothetical protein